MSLPPLAELTKPARQNPSWSLVANRFENEIHFEADEWKGTQWQHSLVVSFPQNNEAESTWVLHITGGEPNDFDLKWSQSLADLSHCPVATLFHIPNQPLWELWEDDLIAQTCVRSLDASDLSWPLLIPMVRSVRTAMSLLQKVAPELWPEFESPKNFIPFGASKRGWTAWLTAATEDPGVRALAPMMFDNLFMLEQLKKQRKDWGHYSSMIEPYISRNLQNEVESEFGKHLLALVDPATYLSHIKVPVLTILGANDPYWCVDASSLYWDKIEGERFQIAIPNLHHAFEKVDEWTPTLVAFCKGVASSESGAGNFGAQNFRVGSTTWFNPSNSFEFAQSQWEKGGTFPKGKNTAVLKLNHFSYGDLKYDLSELIEVVRA